MTYVPCPEKSYVIEPHGGEIKYKLHEKNPQKFYDHVINQDITEHQVRPNQRVSLLRQKSKEEGKKVSTKKIPLEIQS